MSLRKRTLLLTGMSLAALVGVMYLVAVRVLLTGYAQAELQEVERHVVEVRHLLAQRVDSLDSMCNDWSSWDDTYAFAQNGNATYRDRNLNLAGTKILNTNLVVVVDASGRVIYDGWFDFMRSTVTPLPPAFRATITTCGPLLEHRRLDEGRTGFLNSPWGLLMVVSRPILNSDEEGPSHGSLIFGRLMAPDVNLIEKACGLTVQVVDCTPGKLPPDLEAVHSRLTESDAIASRPEGKDVVSGYANLLDMSGRHLALLRVADGRDIYHRAQRSVRAMLVPTVLLGAVFSALLLLILERAVLSRVAHLSSDVAAVGAAGDPAARVSLPGHDELSSLAACINQALVSLDCS